VSKLTHFIKAAKALDLDVDLIYSLNTADKNKKGKGKAHKKMNNPEKRTID
jgi:hypothetical protein